MIHPDNDPDQADLLYYYSGTESCHPGKSWTSVRDHFLFHYVASGTGSVHIHGVDTPLEAGQGFLFLPHEMSSYKASMETPWTYTWVAFKGRRAHSFPGRWNMKQNGHIYQSSNPDECTRELMDTIPRFLRCGNEFDQLSLLYRVFAALERFSLNNRESESGEYRNDRFMSRVFEYIHRNFARNSASIENMADYMGISRTHLCHLVREHTGKTPRDLLMDYRMESAKNLLANSELTIAQVAWSIGYDDQLAFSRAFRNREDQSPRDFRQMSKGQSFQTAHEVSLQ